MAAPGEIIASRYRLDELIGRGGMATVFRAWDLRLARAVAVKLLRPEIVADPDLALRFRREAHAATVLRHPNVVACLDTGTDGDNPYLVMELVEGEDLTTRLRRETRLPVGTAAGIARDIARGLAIAHARGIVHRDVKPGNILLVRDGRAMVTDFGIARVAAEAEGTLPGTTLGSVHYFSPEQAQGTTTTPASDVYSLGLVLYEMLTGTRPFRGDSPAAVAIARIGAPAPGPRDVDPTLPAELDGLVRRALAPDATDRFPNGGAIAEALDGLLAPQSVDPAVATQRVPAPRRGTRAMTGIAVAAGAFVVVASAALMTLLGEEPGVAAIDRTPIPAETAAPGGTTAEPPATTEPTSDPPPAGPTAVPADTVSDVCEPSGEEACPLGPGTYAPLRFQPAFTVELGDGWSAARYTADLVVFGRPEGYLTLASSVSLIHDGDEASEVRSNVRDLLEAIADNDALEILSESRAEIAGHRGVELRLIPNGERAPIFSTGDATYYAETTTVTRLVAFEVQDTPVFVILEGAGDSGLDRVAELADGSILSLSFD